MSKPGILSGILISMFLLACSRRLQGDTCGQEPVWIVVPYLPDGEEMVYYCPVNGKVLGDIFHLNKNPWAVCLGDGACLSENIDKRMAQKQLEKYVRGD
jgi:hypothetical protein